MPTLLIALAVTAGVYVAAVAVLFVIGRRTAAKQIALLLPNLLLLFKGLTRDPRLPRRSKALLAFGAVWFASPIDLIPEVIPVLGPLDDAVVALLILRHVLRTAGPRRRRRTLARRPGNAQPAAPTLHTRRKATRNSGGPRPPSPRAAPEAQWLGESESSDI